MKEVFLINSISSLDNVTNFVLHWIDNKEVVLYAHKGEKYIEHFKTIYPYGKIKNEKCKFFTNENEFLNYLNSNNDKEFRILLALQTIDNVIEFENDSIMVKKENLSKYLNFDKQILTFKYHTNNLSNQNFLYEYLNEMEKILRKKNLWFEPDEQK